MHKLSLESKGIEMEDLLVRHTALLKELRLINAQITTSVKASVKGKGKSKAAKKAATDADADDKASTGSGASKAWAWAKHAAETYAEQWETFKVEWKIAHPSLRGALQRFGKVSISLHADDFLALDFLPAGGAPVPAEKPKAAKKTTKKAAEAVADASDSESASAGAGAGAAKPKKAKKTKAPAAEVFAEDSSVASAGAGVPKPAAVAKVAEKAVEKAAVKTAVKTADKAVEKAVIKPIKKTKKVAANPKIADVEDGDILHIGGKPYFVTSDGRAYHCDEAAETVGKWAGRYDLETGELNTKAPADILHPAA